MKNFTIANSYWSKTILNKYLGLESIVIYPPLNIKAMSVAWRDKSDDFLVIGRISPEKQIDKAISILKNVRRRRFNIRLHICGRIDDTDYGNKIRSLADENKWIILEGLVLGDKKRQLLSSCKYGISGCQHEAFGIATAEMIQSGAIVWVPNGGGQVEVVSHPILTYRDERSAVDKITKVLKNRNLQGDLRRHLRKQAKLFSKDRFIRESIKAIDHFLERGSPPVA